MLSINLCTENFLSDKLPKFPLKFDNTSQLDNLVLSHQWILGFRVRPIYRPIYLTDISVSVNWILVSVISVFWNPEIA